jgi:hypothetical protein
MERHSSLFETAALRSRSWEVAPGATGAHCLRLVRRASDCAASASDDSAPSQFSTALAVGKKVQKDESAQGQSSIAKGCPCTNASLTLPLPTNPLRSVDRRIGSVAVAIVVVLLSCFVFSSPLDHDAGCVGVAWLCARRAAALRALASRSRLPRPALRRARGGRAARGGGASCAEPAQTITGVYVLRHLSLKLILVRPRIRE